MIAQITLAAAKQNTILRGHPWVFPKAIKTSKGRLITGELIAIHNSEERVIGFGVYNEHSLYRVRILFLTDDLREVLTLDAIVRQRFQQAFTVRTLLQLPNSETNAYRLFNSEADGLSGITIDRFNKICVISSSAYWVEHHRILIMDVLHDLLPQDQVLWFSQTKALLQDGWMLNSEPNIDNIYTDILEAGIRYHVDFSCSQKTGLFLDQRDNHQRVASVCNGKKVLDLYCYTGGFALHAAKAGAIQVKAIDSSAAAIQQAQYNAELNGLNQIEFITADARNHLSEAQYYDVIILDPPKLVPSRSHAEKAKNYYRFLHRELFKSMKSGSLLMTCNCSAALSAHEFGMLVSTQARMVAKDIRILGVFGPALCHPTLVSFPEGNYLCAILLVVL